MSWGDLVVPRMKGRRRHYDIYISYTVSLGASCPVTDLRKLQWTLKGKRVLTTSKKGRIKGLMHSWNGKTSTTNLCVNIPRKSEYTNRKYRASPLLVFPNPFQ